MDDGGVNPPASDGSAFRTYHIIQSQPRCSNLLIDVHSPVKDEQYMNYFVRQRIVDVVALPENSTTNAARFVPNMADLRIVSKGAADELI